MRIKKIREPLLNFQAGHITESQLVIHVKPDKETEAKKQRKEAKVDEVGTEGAAEPKIPPTKEPAKEQAAAKPGSFASEPEVIGLEILNRACVRLTGKGM